MRSVQPGNQKQTSPGSYLPVLLSQDPTVCQTLPSGNIPAAFQDHPAMMTHSQGIRTSRRHVPPGTYLLIFHP
ncbi:hypothetical protein NKCBBBOE_01432 [Pseudarthrobacter sp. MM222]|nr:hypothetical protein NKCBBBOE_00641 [Pseudarthrobacter sp. MM222]CAI3795906.1 hypothetical protein NKCBBBOE_01432 [Pseudarthrobacter sp. MM222]